MKQKILEKEFQFFNIQYISDEKWLRKTIHDDFIECGKSGYLFHKEETIQSLLEEQDNRNIKIYNYTYQQIDINTHIVHYITKSATKYYYRTSIWIGNENLQLFYHQASELKEQVELIQYDSTSIR